MAGSEPHRRQIREEGSYSTQGANLEQHPRLGDVLRGLTDSIACNAEKYDVVTGYVGVRLAKSDYHVTPSGLIPQLRIHFRIDDGEEHGNFVTLLHIEVVPLIEDMEMD